MVIKIKKRRLKEKDFVGYNEYLKNKKRMNTMLYNNWKFIHETSMVKVVVGGFFFGLGVLTLPLPTGSVFLIAFGAALMSSGGIDLLTLKDTIYWDVLTRLKMRKNN